MSMRFGWSRTTLALALTVVVATLTPIVCTAEPSSPSADPVRQPPAQGSAESEFNRGVRARVAKDWSTAVAAFRDAINARAAFPEAWNELGYALRNQGRYEESLQAYDEALRLRPNFPEALEYQGEAYVQMGRLDDARRVLERLSAIDTERARELAEAIDKAK